MVNSKKMSKSKVAMIALAILLVLSLVLTATGAWFTRSASDTDSGDFTSLDFGTVGAINISVASTEWKDMAGNAPKQLDGSTARTVFMPGDQLKTGDIVIRYDETYANSAWAASNPAATETKVFYLINDGSRDFVVNNDGKLALVSNGQAGEIEAGESHKLTITGSYIAIKINNLWYKLDGLSHDSDTGADYANAKGSCDIPTNYGATPTEVGATGLDTYDARMPGDVAFSWTAGVTTYTVKIIQHVNMTATEAYNLLHVSA